MPTFTTIVPGRLYQVRDLFTAEQVIDIQTVDWMNLPWMNSPQQQTWLRREIVWDSAEKQRVSRYFDPVLTTINQALGTDFQQSGGQFWIDLPGFTCDLHTDGHLPNAMQIYWLVPGPEYGTGFYQYKNVDSLLYQFESLPNSGYIMLNHLDDSGAQPLQWHAMLNPVPAGSIRVSSYWYFD